MQNRDVVCDTYVAYFEQPLICRFRAFTQFALFPGINVPVPNGITALRVELLDSPHGPDFPLVFPGWLHNVPR